VAWTRFNEQGPVLIDRACSTKDYTWEIQQLGCKMP